MPIDAPTVRDDALLLSIADVCRRLSVGRTLLHQMRRGGKFPLQEIKLGAAVRFRADDLERWVSAGCPGSERWRALNIPAMRRT
jgi:predicted DNA-binding transcriptional regulator AlpA